MIERNLAWYRNEIGWTQDDICVEARKLGIERPRGKPVITRMSVSNAERGVFMTQRTAAVIARALTSGYEKAGLPERFTTETILNLYQQAAQKRAEEKRGNPDSPDEEEDPAVLALAV